MKKLLVLIMSIILTVSVMAQFKPNYVEDEFGENTTVINNLFYRFTYIDGSGKLFLSVNKEDISIFTDGYLPTIQSNDFKIKNNKGTIITVKATTKYSSQKQSWIVIDQKYNKEIIDFFKKSKYVVISYNTISNSPLGKNNYTLNGKLNCTGFTRLYNKMIESNKEI